MKRETERGVYCLLAWLIPSFNSISPHTRAVSSHTSKPSAKLLSGVATRLYQVSELEWARCLPLATFWLQSKPKKRRRYKRRRKSTSIRKRKNTSGIRSVTDLHQARRSAIVAAKEDIHLSQSFDTSTLPVASCIFRSEVDC